MHTLFPPYVSLIINFIFSISLKIVSSVVNNVLIENNKDNLSNNFENLLNPDREVG